VSELTPFSHIFIEIIQHQEKRIALTLAFVCQIDMGFVARLL
jgi:hypothetical protein